MRDDLIRDTILNNANIGLWTIEIDEDVPPRMYANGTMNKLLGIKSKLSPEETYASWYRGIDPDHYEIVETGVNQMTLGIHAEIQYPWIHPDEGEIFVRCGGVRDYNYVKGVRLSGTHQVVSELVHLQQEVKAEQEMLKSIASIYSTLHMIDLEKETFRELASTEIIHKCTTKFIAEKMSSQEIIYNTMKSVVLEAHLEKLFDFVNLSTLSKRMKNKKIISLEVISNYSGWVRFSFIRVGDDNKGKVTKVMLASQIINNERIKEEHLILMSTTDGLTGVYNRRAYDIDIGMLEENGLQENLRYICADVNGLKTLNDTKGHKAGDELICGAASILAEAIGYHGKAYRIGGDEFIGILTCSEEELSDILADIQAAVDDWRGSYDNKMSLSFGIAGLEADKGASILELEKIADTRMYENKKKYYQESGIDRRRG